MRMPLSLPANATIYEDVQGRFVSFVSGAGAVRLTVYLASGITDVVEVSAGDQYEFGDRVTRCGFESLVGAQSVNFEIGYGRFIPREDGQEVTITGQTATLTVDFDAPPEVTVNGGVSAEITDPVEVFQTTVFEVEENAADGITAGVTVAPDVGGVTIAANTSRLALHVRADTANTAAIIVNGVPLEASDGWQTIETTAAIPLAAANAIDSIHYFEVTRS